jgi:hypothetical protein
MIPMAPLPHPTRLVEPEILDSLPADDPEAIRSRRDLRWLDHWLGNSRWILERIATDEHAAAGVVELGAGDGRLCAQLRAALQQGNVTGIDLQPRPVGMDRSIRWIEGDVFETAADMRGGICVASLLLHHFDAAALRVLGGLLNGFSSLIFCEPLRSRAPLIFSKIASPFVGRVTRHDMPVSIRAGFVRDELADLLGLNHRSWRIDESTSIRGILRFHATRK